MKEDVCAEEKQTFTCPPGETRVFGGEKDKCNPWCRSNKNQIFWPGVFSCLSSILAIIWFVYALFSSISRGNSNQTTSLLASGCFTLICMSCCLNSVYSAALLSFAKGFSGSDDPITFQDFMIMFFDVSKFGA